MTTLQTDAAAAPHGGKRVFAGGAPLEESTSALLLVHGRGASPQSIMELMPEFSDEGRIFVAPAAAQNTWYPQRFLAPLEHNQPDLSSALEVLGHLITQITQHVPLEKIALLGFSQGACLVLEYALRHPARYGGVFGLSGGLIGPPGHQWPIVGSLAGTPIFLGCSDEDFHIPKERVEESAAVLDAAGADVVTRLYPGMGHTINRDEISRIQSILGKLKSD